MEDSYPNGGDPYKYNYKEGDSYYFPTSFPSPPPFLPCEYVVKDTWSPKCLYNYKENNKNKRSPSLKSMSIYFIEPVLVCRWTQFKEIYDGSSFLYRNFLVMYIILVM